MQKHIQKNGNMKRIYSIKLLATNALILLSHLINIQTVLTTRLTLIWQWNNHGRQMVSNSIRGAGRHVSQSIDSDRLHEVLADSYWPRAQKLLKHHCVNEDETDLLHLWPTAYRSKNSNDGSGVLKEKTVIIIMHLEDNKSEIISITI